MQRLPSVRRVQGRGQVAALAVAAVLALLLAWWLLGRGDVAALWLVLPWLGFGAACAAAGALWGRNQGAFELREARLDRQVLGDLADTWIWQTDAGHRLTQWRPPQGAPAEAWTPEHTGQVHLHERFELLGPTGPSHVLRTRLDTHSAVNDLVVQWVGQGTRWRLRAQPLFDADGHFCGHLGSAVPLDDTEQQRFDQALLTSLWPDLDVVAIALKPALPGHWCVAALSPEAHRLMRLDTRDVRGMDWDAALALLPEGLAQGAASLSVGQQREAGDWQLSLRALGPEATHGRLLVLRLKSAPMAVADTTTAADQDSFVYSVSHDLRAPIRVVEGFARILKEDYGRFLDRIGNDHLDRVLAAAARMNSMIDALLALSRLQSQPLVRKPVDLSQLANYILEDLRREAPDRAAAISIEPGLIVNGDPTLLRIAMENLLGNAWKYSGQCAHTIIEFRREQHDGKPVMVVADNGAGFDMRFADRLFGVFQRLHSAKDFQGTGVGLASVRRILRRHGGDIWAESEVGKGARFYFTLA
ncbi:sensor histidine kinase [Ideonella margarita]|uniref:histidine kinase n=1 Tax=Ideonella margarita TaxID=2984191 RepID=A0ABU9CB90_9BURK